MFSSLSAVVDRTSNGQIYKTHDYAVVLDVTSDARYLEMLNVSPIQLEDTVVSSYANKGDFPKYWLPKTIPSNKTATDYELGLTSEFELTISGVTVEVGELSTSSAMIDVEIDA